MVVGQEFPILDGHGTPRGANVVGSCNIHPFVFKHLLSGFKDGVQVNAISGACHPGRFVDAIKSSGRKDRYFAVPCPSDETAPSTMRSISNRTRNSRFPHAFVQSLSKVSLPGVTRRRITWWISDHELFTKNQLARNPTPGGRAVSRRFYASELVNGVTAVEELIFRDKIDIVYDHCVSSRRRRPEWPTTDANIRNHLFTDGYSSPATIPESAKIIVDNVVAKCNARGDLRPDLGVYDELLVKHLHWRYIMRNLYWRVCRQSAVLDIFKLLI